MEDSLKLFKEIKKINEDFEKNKEKYLENLKKLARELNFRVFLFGSFLEKEKFVGGSDVDVLIVVQELTKEKRYKLLRKLKEIVNENPRFEFHIIDEKEFELRKRFIKKIKEIKS